jgi:hypothetical protein
MDMMPKTEDHKAALSAVRERIALAKRHGTHRGFIDYYGCISVCNEFTAILEDARKAAESGDYAYAYAVAALILIDCAKLAGTADDSAGGIIDTIREVKDVLDITCAGVEYGSVEAEFIYLQSLKDSQNKAFIGWDEFAYDLLLPTASLASKENVDKLYVVLDEFSLKLSQKEYSSWHLESDSLVRLAAITAVDGEQAAEAFINDHIQFDEIRKIAYRKAMDFGDLSRAEKLCIDKIDSTDRSYHWTEKWYGMLFDVYLKMGDKVKQAKLAQNLLINKKDTSYYAILKNLLTEQGTWGESYPTLLARLSQSLPYNLFMSILSQEGKTEKLMSELREHPTMVFLYGKQLSADFPMEVFAICLSLIRGQAAESNCRKMYKDVCSSIRKLFDFGGVSEAESIIVELKVKYPQRPAMIDELDKLAERLSKRAGEKSSAPPKG